MCSSIFIYFYNLVYSTNSYMHTIPNVHINCLAFIRIVCFMTLNCSPFPFWNMVLSFTVISSSAAFLAWCSSELVITPPFHIVKVKGFVSITSLYTAWCIYLWDKFHFSWVENRHINIYYTKDSVTGKNGLGSALSSWN